MSNMADTEKVPLAWLRANLKAILLTLNALILVVLLYSVISWTFFEIRTRRLLATVAEIETSQKKAEEPKDTKGASVAPPGQRRPEREQTTGTVTSESTSSPTKPTSPSMAVARADGLSTATAATTTVVAASPRRGSRGGREMRGIPDEAFARMTGPGGRFEGMSHEEVRERMRERAGAMGGFRGGREMRGIPDEAFAQMTGPGGRFEGMSREEVHERIRGGAEPTSASLPGSGLVAALPQPIADWISNARRTVVRTLAQAVMQRPAGPGSRRPPRVPEDPKKKEMFDKLAKRALFGGSRPAGPREPQLAAILGDSALINGKWLKVGEKFGESKVLEIATNKIVIEGPEGKRRELMVVAAGGSPGRPPSAAGARRPSGEEGGPPSAPPPGAMAPRGEGPRRGMMGMGEIPDAIFQRLTGPGGPFEGASREELRERMGERMRERRERMGGRGGDRGRRGPPR